MLVQDRDQPKIPQLEQRIPARNSRHPSRFSQSKSLDFSTWLSDNLYKVVTVVLLILTVATIFFLRNVGDSAALLCFQSKAQQLEKIVYPRVNWNKIDPIIDKSSPYANLRSENWIIVSVSNHPTDSLRNLAKIKGWKVLAIGNSKTPPDWNLKGTIFLSLEQQAKLGYRIIDYLPYESYVRKSIGYLFAIQHGANKIFDADDRGDVIDNDIDKHFDIELMGKDARQDIILQYSHENPNRTVVNPYIHFGQRSVWPRGLPLENVGQISNEEYYTEVLGGRQYIQQGTSNGLPDVDSVFYFTRKSGLEPFDIRFDDHAPKVALPQGIMVPINSFNTLYHASAFWAMMLPVSVSTMASDILRGYFSQRLLWEIGGFVVVYPPTVHRHDRIEGYPFSEEKDLHVNVGRLIKFLVEWRSKEFRLFEKILELSYVMAEEGFWTEKDVKFTAAWLQDLLAVRYRQPRLMSTHFDRQRAYIGFGDRKDFVPSKLPSAHLGVEEIGAVNSEIGNLIKWRKYFGNVVLLMFCDESVERTALEWRLLYGRIFKTVVILSEKKNVDLVVEEGHLDHLYKQIPSLLNRFPSAEGFLFLHDDTVLNYWNLLQTDKSKLWIPDKVHESCNQVKPEGNSEWIKKQLEMVNRFVNSMPVHFQVTYKSSISTEDNKLHLCNSEIFYIPRRFVSGFKHLVHLVGDLNIHQKVAIPLFFTSMDLPQNFDPIFNTMVYKKHLPNDSTSIYTVNASAIHPWKVSTEQEFIKLVRIMAAGDPLLMELV